MAEVGSGGDLMVMMGLAAVGVTEIDSLGEEDEGTANDEDGAEHGYGLVEASIKRAATVSS